MWYLVIIFAIVFQAVISIFAPYFPGIIIASEGITAADYETISTTGEAMALSVNPFNTFIDIMTFSIDGAEALSIIFILLDILIVLCILQIVKDVININLTPW